MSWESRLKSLTKNTMLYTFLTPAQLSLLSTETGKSRFRSARFAWSTSGRGNLWQSCTAGIYFTKSVSSSGLARNILNFNRLLAQCAGEIAFFKKSEFRGFSCSIICLNFSFHIFFKGVRQKSDFFFLPIIFLASSREPWFFTQVNDWFFFWYNRCLKF